MKIRIGHVSNSSSCSFTIPKDKLNSKQIEDILNHSVECEQFGMHCDPSDVWSITDHGRMIEGSTWMDNFDMERFLNYIGVNPDDIEWWHS